MAKVRAKPDVATRADYEATVVVAWKRSIPNVCVEVSLSNGLVKIRQADIAGMSSEESWTARTARTLAQHLVNVADLIEYGDNMIEEVA